MSLVFWWAFFFLNLIASTTNKPLVLGFTLILMSFYLLVILMGLMKFWYSLIFFLIYVGAVLVLVFYMICVNSNPMNYYFSFLGVFSFLVFLIFHSFLGEAKYKFSFRGKNLGFSFLSFFEVGCMLFLFCFLLFLLWVMSKFTFLSVGSIRSFV